MMWLNPENSKHKLLAALLTLVICISLPTNLLAKPLHWMAVTNIPPGAQIAILKGDPSKPGPFIARLKLPAHYIMPAHSHDISTQVTVISGTYYVGNGDVADANNGTPLHAGQVINLPANNKHYGWTTAETIIQVSGMGPWEMNYSKNG